MHTRYNASQGVYLVLEREVEDDLDHRVRVRENAEYARQLACRVTSVLVVGKLWCHADILLTMHQTATRQTGHVELFGEVMTRPSITSPGVL